MSTTVKSLNFFKVISTNITAPLCLLTAIVKNKTMHLAWLNRYIFRMIGWEFYIMLLANMSGPKVSVNMVPLLLLRMIKLYWKRAQNQWKLYKKL